MWFPLLSLLFIGLTVSEIWVLITIGGEIGAAGTIGLIVATGVVGAWLARREGLRTMREFGRLANQGVLPGKPIFDGVAILVGAAFLMTPGLITDVLGFSLLLPPTRALFRAAAAVWAKKKIQKVRLNVNVNGNVRMDPGWGPQPPQPPQPDPDTVYDQTFEEADAEANEERSDPAKGMLEPKG